MAFQIWLLFGKWHSINPRNTRRMQTLLIPATALFDPGYTTEVCWTHVYLLPPGR